MSAAAAELEQLRSKLEARFGGVILPAGVPAREREERPGFRVGVEAVDRVLPGGVARNAVTLWTGEAGAGRTAALWALVEGACGSGALVAVVDAGRTLDASFGCAGGRRLEGLWVVRPPEGGREAEGVWAMEALLRAGVFDLLVLDGCVPDGAQGYRLRGLAREQSAALLVSVDVEGVRGVGGTGWRADARVEFRRAGDLEGELGAGGIFRRRSRLRATGVEREVELVHEPADRLRPGAPGRDRRPRAR
jgi:RecA/RadA recombinase